MTRPASKAFLRALVASSAKPPVVLTVESVESLLKATRSRPVTHLCRAYLQFGAEAMSPDDLGKLRAALARRTNQGKG